MEDSEWMVTCRAVDHHGAPDKYVAIRVYSKPPIRTADEAICWVRKEREAKIRSQHPCCCLVDWTAKET